jgi:hypothetical protein
MVMRKSLSVFLFYKNNTFILFFILLSSIGNYMNNKYISFLWLQDRVLLFD